MENKITPQPSKSILIRSILSLIGILAILAGLLFLPAERCDWLEGWLYILTYGILLVVFLIWGLFKDPAQFLERSKSRKPSETSVKNWDRVIMAIYTVLLPLLFILSSLDVCRFQWSTVSLPVKITAWTGLLFSGVWIMWVLFTNTYLSAMARIQSDRSQIVVDRGPYRFIRHPMYLGILILFLCTPPALGSRWALIPAFAIDVLFVIRTALEDRMLKQELAGYHEYSRRVRYRLIPGIW